MKYLLINEQVYFALLASIKSFIQIFDLRYSCFIGCIFIETGMILQEYSHHKLDSIPILFCFHGFPLKNLFWFGRSNLDWFSFHQICTLLQDSRNKIVFLILSVLYCDCHCGLNFDALAFLITAIDFLKTWIIVRNTWKIAPVYDG